jgi:hypothetical protein
MYQKRASRMESERRGERGEVKWRFSLQEVDENFLGLGPYFPFGWCFGRSRCLDVSKGRVLFLDPLLKGRGGDLTL